MFLGTHTPRLDDKGRLILPAKFRDELAGGVVITKGQERCLYVFPMPEFQRIAGQLREQPVTHKAARAYSRVFFASAHDEVPDKQGRVTIPAPPAGVRGTGSRARGDRGEHAGGDLGQAVLGAVPLGERGRLRRHRGGGAARRTVGRGHRWGPRPVGPDVAAAVLRDLQPLPLLAPLPRRQAHRPPAAGTSGWGSGGTDRRPATDRVERRFEPGDGGRHGGASRHTRAGAARAMSRAARSRAHCGLPGAVHVDFTLGLGGHAEAVLERFPDVVLIGLDRDTEALAHSRHRLARFADRTHLVHAVYDELPAVLDRAGLRRVPQWPVRPGRVLAATGRAGPRVRLRAGRAAGHADGPEPRGPRPRRS